MTATTAEQLEANKKIARDYIDQVFNQHNPGKAADFVTSDIVWHGNSLGDVAGAENLAGLLGSFIGALPDLYAAEQDITAENDLVMVRLVVAATVKGKPARGAGRRQAGLVERHRHLPDHRWQDQRGMGRRRHRDHHDPGRCLHPAVGCLTVPSAARPAGLTGRARPAGEPHRAGRAPERPAARALPGTGPDPRGSGDAE
jgi:hypothetical protein